MDQLNDSESIIYKETLDKNLFRLFRLNLLNKVVVLYFPLNPPLNILAEIDVPVNQILTQIS